MAATYEQKKENTLAIEEYQSIASSSELYISAQIRAAMLLKDDGKIKQAIDLLHKVIKKKNDQMLLYLILSALYDESGDYATSEKTLKDGLVVAPQNTDLLYALGVLYDKTKRFTESVDAMKKILDIDPKNAEALNFIGYSYAERGVNLEEAEKLILSALELKSDSGYLLDSLGWVYFKQGKLRDAEKYLKEALKLLPDEVEIIEHLGDIFVKQNRIKEAVDLYERGLKIDPENISLKSKIEEMKKKRP